MPKIGFKMNARPKFGDGEKRLPKIQATSAQNFGLRFSSNSFAYKIPFAYKFVELPIKYCNAARAGFD